MATPSSENTPQPDPKKDDGAEANDLSKANLPEGGGDAPAPREGTHAASGSPGEAENPDEVLRELLPTLRALCERQQHAADAGATRPDITDEELHAMVRGARIIRSMLDQSEAPPVDSRLVRMATWKQLPQDLGEMVQGLGLRWENWNQALLAEETRAIAIQDAAEFN